MLLAQKELFQLGKLALCTDKVCSIVAPNGTQTASKADVYTLRCDERIRREILDHFQMSSLRWKGRQRRRYSTCGVAHNSTLLWYEKLDWAALYLLAGYP